MTMGLRVAVAAASVLLVAGCASPAPAPITEEQELAFRAQLEDDAWRNSGLPDSDRPDIPRAEPVSLEVYFEEFSGCLTQRTQGEGAPLANYICQRSYQLSTNDYGYFSAQQRDGLYDYFQQTVVPCLVTHGYDVGYPPPRDTESSEPGYLQWSPYWTLTGTAVAGPGDPETTCPQFPSWAQ